MNVGVSGGTKRVSPGMTLSRTRRRGKAMPKRRVNLCNGTSGESIHRIMGVLGPSGGDVRDENWPSTFFVAYLFLHQIRVVY